MLDIIITSQNNREKNLKGHCRLWDHTDLDTTFASLKSVYLNLKSNLSIGYI